MPTSPVTMQNLRSSIVHGIKNNTLKIDEVKLFMYNALLEHPAVLTEDWSSFGISIGKKGASVTIDALFHRAPTQVEMNLSIMQGITAKDDLWILIYICSMYRLLIIDRKDNRHNIVKIINERLGANSAAKEADVNMSFKYESWLNDPAYIALLAIIDLYMVKFPKHVFAEVRIGTIVTRHRDCAGALDLLHITKVADMDLSHLARWIWQPELGDEFERLQTPLNEIDKYDSYMPYFMDLGLSSKSPYSTAVNPDFHYWVHAVCACINSPISKNVRVVGQVHTCKHIELSKHACILGYALTTVSDAKLQSTQDPPIPDTLIGDNWFKWYIGNGWRSLQIALDRFKTVFSTYGDSDDGTVAKQLYAYHG